MTNRNKSGLFYVIQFIESPFEGIDDYVYVPYSWLLLQRSSGRKVVVTYPNNEDPLETRLRVKRKERPKDEWRFYMALIKYETEDYRVAEYWIATRNGPGKEESEIRDTQLEPALKRKVRSSSQPFGSGPISDKPQLTTKFNKNLRKPLPRILIRRSLSQNPNKPLDNKRLKLSENAKPGIVTDHAIIASGCSKQEPPVIITNNQLIQNDVIQNDETKNSFTSNGGMNTEQSTQPGIIRENQSVDKSIQSSSKLLAEQQPSLKLLDETQRPPHPSTNQQPSLKLTVEKQLSPVGFDYQPPLSMSDVDLDKADENIESCQNVLTESVIEERLSMKISPNTREQAPQPEPINERSTLLVRHNHSFPEPYPQDVSVRQSKEPVDSHLKRILTTQTIQPKLPSAAKKQIPVAKNPKNHVDKKTRLEGIAKNITAMKYPPSSTMQLSLVTGLATEPLAQNHSQARVNSSLINDVRCSMGEECVDQRDLLTASIMNTSAAQSPSKLAHHYSSIVGPPREQHFLSTQEDHFQQFARMQDMLRNPTISRTIDPRVYHQNAIMNEGYVMQSQPTLINQPIQFLSRNHNQCIPMNSAYAQKVIRHGLIMEPIEKAHTTYKPIVQSGVNIQLTAHNSSNQLHQNSKHPQQKQYPLNYQMREALSNAPRNSLFQEINLQNKLNQRYTEYNNINLADVRENFTVEPVLTAQDSQVQTMLSYDRPQSTLAQSNYVYRHPHMKKTMVDQATETDSIIEVDLCVHNIPGSSVGKSTNKLVNIACQTDDWFMEDQGSLYQETASDSENETEHEIELENGVISEANETTLTAVQNPTPDNQQTQSRIDVEQDMLDTFGTLLTQMGANLSVTRDMFNYLRNSVLVCAQTYEKLLEQVEKFNSVESLQVPASSPNNITTQERPGVDNDNNTGVGDAPTPGREQRGTFSLPAEYDPNDSKWTLKYREYKPGLVELLPRTGVYVSKKKLKRRIQESTDCRTLARLLLTEVFSKNALSVCSLTGGKPKAFNSVNIDVRPGLDEHARMVLLTFVEEHGNKHGWNTSDTSAVISSIRTKINKIRKKVSIVK